MAITLYCRNGHDLSTYDPVFMGRTTFRHYIAMQQQAERDRVAPRQPFCTECGAPTLDCCDHCKAPIGKRSQPAYCGNCGKPFPWTETALATAAEYADGLSQLTQAEKAELKGTLIDLTADTPRTPLAVSRFKKIMGKVGPVAFDAFSKILVNVLTEAAKKGAGL